MKGKIFILFCFFIFTINFFSQSQVNQLSLAEKEYNIVYNYFLQEKYASSISLWKKIINRHSGTDFRNHAELRLGESFMFIGDLDLALETLMQLERRIGTDTNQQFLDRLHLDKGIIYYKINQPEEALKEFFLVQESNTILKSESYKWLNDIFVDLKNYKSLYDTDIWLLEKGVDIKKKSDLYYNVGLAAAYTENWSRAVGFLAEFLDKSNNPADKANITEVFPEILWDARFYDDAIKEKEKLLGFKKSKNDSLEIYLDLMRSLSSLNKFDQYSKYKDYIEKNIPYVSGNGLELFYNTLADDFYIKNKLDDSLQNYENLLQSTQDSSKVVWSLFQLGNISRHKLDYPKALEYYTRVVNEFSDSLLADYSNFYIKTINFLNSIPNSIKENISQRKEIPKEPFDMEEKPFKKDIPILEMKKIAVMYNLDIGNKKEENIPDVVINYSDLNRGVKKPEKKIEPPTPTDKLPYTIQILANSNYEVVKKNKEILEKNDYYPYVMETKKENGLIFYRLRYGAFGNLAEAKVTAQKIKELLNINDDLWIVK